MPSSNKYLCSTYTICGTVQGFLVIEQGMKRQIPLHYWSSHSSRGWGGKINTECQMVIRVTEKNNAWKEDRVWVTGRG